MIKKIIVLLTLCISASASELNKLPIEIVASFYGGKFQNRLTANGDHFDTAQMTAAYNQVALGKEVEVCHEDKCIVVKVNDRTAKRYSSRIDLSKGAFKKLAHTDKGLIKVQIKEL